MCLPSISSTNDGVCSDSGFRVQSASSGITHPEGSTTATISDRYEYHPCELMKDKWAISLKSLGTTVLVVLAGIYLRYCGRQQVHLPRSSIDTSLSCSSSTPADICTDFHLLERYLRSPVVVLTLIGTILLQIPPNWRDRIEAYLQHQFLSVKLWTTHGHNKNDSHINLKRSGGSHNRALSALSRVTSVDTFKNLSKNLLNSLDNSCYSALQAITRKECFARSDYIERLSVNDVAILFRYAFNAHMMTSNGNTTDKSKFLSKQSAIVRAVITAMDMAVKVSRGCLAEGSGKPSPSSQQREQQQPMVQGQSQNDAGEMDALYFVAATRIFAEWRTLRLVPKGYQRYAVALSLAYRDVLQNLEKMERGVHAYLKHHQSRATQNNNIHSTVGSPVNIPSPTLRQLLQFEVDTMVHKKLPYLTEKSSASGLLWTKRQLHYQTATFHNMLEVPVYYPTPRDAAQAAYRIVYNEYHGWAIQQIFSHGFGGSPPLDILWTNLDPPKNLPEGSNNNHHGNDRNNSNNNNNNNKTKQKADTCGLVSSSSSQYGHERRQQEQRKRYNQSSPLYSFDDPPERTLSDVTDGNQTHSGSSERDDGDNHRRSDDIDNPFIRSWENMGRGVSEKWEDILRLFNCGGMEEKRKKKHNLILSSESHFSLNQLVISSGVANEVLQQQQQHNYQCDDDCVTAVTALSTQSSSSSSSGTTCYDHYDGIAVSSPVTATTTALPLNPIERSQRDTEDYVRVISPMIADLGRLLDEFHMNDPSRV